MRSLTSLFTIFALAAAEPVMELYPPTTNVTLNCENAVFNSGAAGTTMTSVGDCISKCHSEFDYIGPGGVQISPLGLVSEDSSLIGCTFPEAYYQITEKALGCAANDDGKARAGVQIIVKPQAVSDQNLQSVYLSMSGIATTVTSITLYTSTASFSNSFTCEAPDAKFTVGGASNPVDIPVTVKDGVIIADISARYLSDFGSEYTRYSPIFGEMAARSLFVSFDNFVADLSNITVTTKEMGPSQFGADPRCVYVMNNGNPVRDVYEQSCEECQAKSCNWCSATGAILNKGLFVRNMCGMPTEADCSALSSSMQYVSGTDYNHCPTKKTSGVSGVMGVSAAGLIVAAGAILAL